MKRSNSLRNQTDTVSNMLHGLLAGAFGVVILTVVLQVAVALA